ncbi:MAG: hypothetical protein PWQ84_1521 [Thermotogaceae bacterium]|nr:hypothetical protein [Thermotogaceae bacterium]
MLSKELYVGLGDEVINDFLQDMVVSSNDNMDSLSILAKERTIDLFITGTFKQLNGKLTFQLFLEEFSPDLTSPETLIFSIKPIGTLSKMAFPSIKIFKDRLDPFFVFKKNILIVNLYEIITQKKPALLSILERYSLQNLSIEPGIIMINLIKKL